MTTRIDKIVAILTAGLINMILAYWLLYVLRHETPPVGNEDSRIKLTWITRPAENQRPYLSLPANFYKPVAKPAPSREALVGKTASSSSDSLQSKLHETIVVADDDWDDLNNEVVSIEIIGGFERPLVRPPRPDFSGRQILPNFKMQDSSPMGRLNRISELSECGELRAALRKSASNGSSVDVIIQSLQARGCKI